MYAPFVFVSIKVPLVAIMRLPEKETPGFAARNPMKIWLADTITCEEQYDKWKFQSWEIPATESRPRLGPPLNRRESANAVDSS